MNAATPCPPYAPFIRRMRPPAFLLLPAFTWLDTSTTARQAMTPPPALSGGRGGVDRPAVPTAAACSAAQSPHSHLSPARAAARPRQAPPHNPHSRGRTDPQAGCRLVVRRKWSGWVVQHTGGLWWVRGWVWGAVPAHAQQAKSAEMALLTWSPTRQS